MSTDRTSATSCTTYRFQVKGMTCSACVSRVEKAAQQVPGIESSHVNLLQNTIEVTSSNLSIPALQAALKKAGYQLVTDATENEATQPDLSASESVAERNKLIASFALLVVVMYLSMGPMMGLALPFSLGDSANTLLLVFIELILSLIIGYLGRDFFVRGFKALWHRSPNMDSLVAIGAGATFLYGLYSFAGMLYYAGHGNFEALQALLHTLYLESAATILTLVRVGKWFESRAKHKTLREMNALIDLKPTQALVLRNNEEVLIDLEAVQPNDILVLRTGLKVPADAQLLDGHLALDESAMTGESLPVDKDVGDTILAGTTILEGFAKAKILKTGNDTVLGQMIALVEHATSAKAPISRIADKVSAIFVPIVITISLITWCIWYFLTGNAEVAFNYAMTVLVISCPCALGLATPTAIMVGMGLGAKHGLIIKTPAILEALAQVKEICLDKTGTITLGQPQVTNLYLPNSEQRFTALMIAQSLEACSEHPLSAPIIRLAQNEYIPKCEVQNFKQHQGMGLTGVINGLPFMIGNQRMLEHFELQSTKFVRQTTQQAHKAGETLLWVALLKHEDTPAEIYGAIGLKDIARPEAKEVIERLQQMGIGVTLLTGDARNVAQAIASEVGIENYQADLLPNDKARYIEAHQTATHSILMVGDGVNDTPAFSQARTSAAVSTGTDLAMVSADIILMRDDLSCIPTVVALSRATLANIRQNLAWAFIYNIAGIPLAAGALAAWGWHLNPMIASAAMSLSSVSVVLNALRLRRFKAPLIHSCRAQTSEGKEIHIMTPQKVILHVEGMTCQHCVNTVSKALSALPTVSNVEVDLDAKTAKCDAGAFATDELLRRSIENAGFTVVDIDRQ